MDFELEKMEKTSPAQINLQNYKTVVTISEKSFNTTAAKTMVGEIRIKYLNNKIFKEGNGYYTISDNDVLRQFWRTVRNRPKM